MTINEYQNKALRTAKGLKDVDMITNGAMGLCGEAGEFIDLVKKWKYQGHPLDVKHAAKELGDVAWYLAVAAEGLGYTLESILQMNVDKLLVRYPEGFDTGKSQHRKEGDI